MVMLLEKYHKMYMVLRTHRKWENEKMFGKSLQAITYAGLSLCDYQYFTNKKIQNICGDKTTASAEADKLKKETLLPISRQYVRSFFPAGTQGTA